MKMAITCSCNFSSFKIDMLYIHIVIYLFNIVSAILLYRFFFGCRPIGHQCIVYTVLHNLSRE